MTAETAFFDDPFGSNRDVSIKRTFHFFWPLRGVPIKILDSIRTGGCAISATDASMINLCHEPFFVFVGRVDGADLGARWVIAMHARPGKQPGLDMRIFPLDIRDQLYPTDRATFR
jgi:hypothetical protein